MAKRIQDIKSRRITSAYVDLPFDKGKESLEKAGYRIISLEENAKLRMQKGKSHDICIEGNWTREGVVYIPNKGKFLTKNSPIMANAEEAADCHRNGKEFYLTKKQIEEALVDSIKIKEMKIPTNRFGENEITVYAFGKSSKKYGEFLREAGIKEMPIRLANLEDKPLARQMWFCWLEGGGRSDLGGDRRDLYYDLRVRGVYKNAEGTQKNSKDLLHTKKEFEKYSKLIQEVRNGNLPASKLEEVLGFFEKLK